GSLVKLVSTLLSLVPSLMKG
uniref:Poneritoxin n=1 Tax=Dinoponera quadriceps TaxID=609295 RepID=TX3AB_DINQU|nr:RecName: Full=Poneritoxin; AltName: Full=Poneratoxin; AltName: Full=Venom peptides; Contains: RecName: Full=U1-poneritoxin-Dq3e; Short=U1-PONTX-Dq3e; AltName: Full=Peptide Dq-1984; Contains: RecName: Full=U1-poneritoxin-Dq3d; Short=U1-PONTX-Dq3d; AltName: Full=Peptide Dq-1897; Contains: RecName: Full=U1-poneritoxin-Dq3a/U1-poneritoxin-Dq3b/U1-poneritoxin-Dq3c; Short=U1-PONTX-Dq3a/U1-PONTX-Dq3b/U1-PONTX-Dq3c; AltName: Full=Peptide Dq-1839/Dq-1840/Dq-1856 [Dinoponera quadriceps]